jgi:hypothetical protein
MMRGEITRGGSSPYQLVSLSSQRDFAYQSTKFIEFKQKKKKKTPIRALLNFKTCSANNTTSYTIRDSANLIQMIISRHDGTFIDPSVRPKSSMLSITNTD